MFAVPCRIPTYLLVPIRYLFLLAALAVTATPALAQNPLAAPSFGNVELDEGFVPDPYDVDLVAGGTISVEISGCSYGMVADAPDFDLTYTTSGDSDLVIYVIAGDDTTILVNLPDGSWACDDDSYGDGDPLLIIPSADAGLYDIWVGTYGSDPVEATLYISEVDPR